MTNTCWPYINKIKVNVIIMRTLLVLAMVSFFVIPGCISAETFGEQSFDIYAVYGMSGWEVTHHFEKDENNQTIETLTELEIEYSPESEIGAEFVEFWLLPGDDSEKKTIDPSQNNTIQHMYTGYGAFMAKFGVIDSEGNEDSMPRTESDWPAVIRSANFYINQSQAGEPANLFVDAPNPNSVGSAERMNVESTIGNSWALPFTSQPTDITWELIDPEGNIVETHSETLDVGEDFTWEVWLESPMRGSWLLNIDSSQDVNIDQTTKIRMDYAGYMYNDY
ncbi:MAG: hypothetical protein DWB99_03630 [Candidatus Poseidoniales archaeon]|nr:MAG: hypothetical protein DWB99_03630 [Candidatus Poseidoniales archaeon]